MTYNSNGVRHLIDAAKRICIQTGIEHGDGVSSYPTLDVEALERAVHNLDKSFLPDHPDSQALPCAWNCAYCRANDAMYGGKDAK